MIYVNFHFMGNILFNFLPSRDAIVNKGYKRLLKLLAQYPAFRSHLYASSRTGLALKNDYPEVFKMIRDAVDDGWMRIEFNGYEHAAFNCLSPDSVRRQIEKGLETDAQIWETQPGGYWPSDCRWDPYAGCILREKGLKWIFLHQLDFKNSNPGGPFYADWKNLDLRRPILVRCPGGVRIPAFHYANVNYDLFRPGQNEAFFSQLDGLNNSAKDDACVSIGLDFETLPVLEVKGICQDAVQVMKEFLDKLGRLPFVTHAFAGEILERLPPRQEAFVRQAYWGHFGGAYPDGAQRILSLCGAAERDLLMCADLLALTGDTPENSARAKKIEAAWEYLLMAQNSEVWFTDPPTDANSHVFYPKEGLVMETIEQAMKALNTAREIKAALRDEYRHSCGKKRRPLV